MTVNKTFTFGTASDYTYDNTLVTTANDKFQLKVQAPTDATIYIPFSTDLNPLWGNGSLVATPSNGESIVGNKLDLTGETVQYVDFDADGNADFQQTGCIRFRGTPDFTGSPSEVHTLFTICKAAGDTTNEIKVTLKANGKLHFYARDEDDLSIEDQELGACDIQSGVEHDFEFNFNFTTGAYYVFIDGTLFYTGSGAIGTRSADIGLFRIGSDASGTTKSDCYFRNFLLFSTVQHTATYTPDWNIPSTVYSTANPTVVFPVLTMELLSSFSAVTTVAGSDLVKYTLAKDGTYYYHTGSAWAASNNTYAQSNTAAEINTYASTFTATGVSVLVKAFLHSHDGSTSPTITSVSVGYDAFGLPADVVEKTVVYGYIYDSNGVAENNVEVSAKLMGTGPFLYKTGTYIYPSKYITHTRSTGYWELELVDTDNISETAFYAFNFSGNSFRRTVPRQDIISFTDLD